MEWYGGREIDALNRYKELTLSYGPGNVGISTELQSLYAETMGNSCGLRKRTRSITDSDSPFNLPAASSSSSSNPYCSSFNRNENNRPLFMKRRCSEHRNS